MYIYFSEKNAFRGPVISTFSLNSKNALEETTNESRLKGNRVCNSACCYVATSNYTHVHFPREETTASDD